jgi:hypothetical protein
MKYFLKKCGSQELGSVGASGRPRRGRYLLISMNPEVLSFFPPLSTAQLNDFVPVACKPLFGEERKAYCNFVYHNNKFHGSSAKHPRNEYRLYLNKNLESGQNLFVKDDILVFRKENETDINSSLYIEYIPVGSSYYTFFDQKIADSGLAGGYAIYEGNFQEMEAKIAGERENGENISIDKKIIKAFDDAPDTPNAADLFNQVMFRDFLLVGYNGLCAVTRTVIRHGVLMNIEAAHIRPHAHHGNYLPSNGLMLSRDLHWAFDKGFFTITDNYKVKIHKDSNSSFLAPFEGRDLFIPEDPFFRPNLENIKWHRDNVFGTFRNIRKLED